MGNLKERQQQLRREAILEAAQHLLEQQGYASFNMDELASQVGISKATLYQDFSSKDELAVQVVLQRMKEGEATLRDVAASLPPIEKLERILRFSIQKRIHMAVTRFVLPPHLREEPLIVERRTRAIEGLTMTIEAAKADGSIRKELPTSVIICMFFSFFSPNNEELLRDEVVTPEELSEALVSIFMNGICSK